MGNIIGAWDGAAETAIRTRHLDEPTQTMHEYIEGQKEECWQTMKKNAGLTFVGCEMMLDPATHELFQELVTLAADRREYGAVGASEAAIGRAAMAWLEAEIARVAEPAGGVA